jgi:glutamate dehydrogenase
VDKFRVIIDELLNVLPSIMATDSRTSYDKNLAKYSEFGVGIDLAKKIAAMDPLGSAYDIIEISNRSDFDIKIIGKIYFEVGTRLNIKWLRGKVSGISSDDYWQRLSTKTILEDLYNYQMKITKQVVDFSCRSKDACPTELSLQKWIESTSFLVERYDGFIADLKSQINPDLPMMVVALNRIKALVS